MAEKSSISTFMSNSLEQLKKKDARVFHYDVSEEDLTRLTECPICGSSDLQPISDVRLKDEVRFFETSVCTSCKFVFRSVFPSFAWFKKRWAQISTQSGEVFNPELEEERKVRYRAYCEMLLPYVKPGGVVLDIGGGYGSGVSVFRDAGFEVELLEPEDDRIHYARNELGLTAHHTVLEEFEPQRRYDLVLWAHNLEHVDGPRESFKRVMSLLKPEDGVLYVEVPLVWNIIDWSDSMFMAHKSNFAEAHLRRLVTENNARAVHKWYPKLNSPIHEDIGLVVRQGADGDDVIDLKDDVSDTDLVKFHELYLRMMPCDLPDGIVRPLHFEVPYINQFYTTVRYNEGEFQFDAATGTIRFEK